MRRATKSCSVDLKGDTEGSGEENSCLAVLLACPGTEAPSLAADPEDPAAASAWATFALDGRTVRARLGATGLLIKHTHSCLSGLQCSDCLGRWPGQGAHTAMHELVQTT